MDNRITIKVKVTPLHIACGMARAPESCPIALALKEQHKEFYNISVGSTATTMSCPETKKNYGAELPPEAQWFVQSFDNRRPVKPLEFTLEFRQFDTK